MKDIDYDRIIKLFKAHEALLNISYKNDKNLFSFDFNKCIEIIECLNKNKINLPTFESKIIITEGNPYLTIIICIYCILNNKSAIINIQGNLVNTNKQICNIFINEYDLIKNRTIEVREEMSISEMIDYCQNREITVIDSKVSYNKYKRYGFNPKYIPFFSIDVIYNDSKYEKLVESVFNYCELNLVEISVLKNIKIEEYKIRINNMFESNSVLLLEEKITKDEAKNVLKTKKIYLNKNPFKDFEIECIRGNKQFI